MLFFGLSDMTLSGTLTPSERFTCAGTLDVRCCLACFGFDHRLPQRRHSCAETQPEEFASNVFMLNVPDRDLVWCWLESLGGAEWSRQSVAFQRSPFENQSPVEVVLTRTQCRQHQKLVEKKDLVGNSSQRGSQTSFQGV